MSGAGTKHSLSEAPTIHSEATVSEFELRACHRNQIVEWL